MTESLMNSTSLYNWSNLSLSDNITRFLLNGSNYNNGPLVVPVYTILISAFFYIITVLAGCFGNALVIFVVIRNKFLQHNTNFCLLNLSVADLLLLCVCMPIAFVDLFSEEIWYFGYILCKVSNWLEHTVVHASVLTMSSICVERYLAITRPLMVKRISKQLLSIVIILIWLISVVAALPFMLVTSHREAFHRKYNKTVQICHTEFKHSWQKSYLFVTLVGFYIVPCILLFFQYGRIIYIVRNTHVFKVNINYENNDTDNSIKNTELTHSNNSSNYQLTKVQTNIGQTNPLLVENFESLKKPSRKRRSRCSIVRIRPPNKNHKQTTKMLFVMMILFFICILPYRIFSIWAVYAEPQDFFRLGIENYYNILAWVRVMFYLNSATNPILYHILSTKFQTAFKRSIYCWRHSSSRSGQLKPCLKK